jgi:imidazolonepropionase
MIRVREVIKMGTGALEIKSGYGLTLENELKMLRVARKIRDTTNLTIKTTFLGAHAVPSNVTKEAYIKTVIEEMIPQVALEKLADYCDVFCEEGFFTEKETVSILKAGQQYGLKSKVHANQLSLSGGVQAGVRVSAVSVDHLETVGKEEIQALKDSATIATLLPGAAFFLRMSYPPVRDMINEGLPVALASDYNPGSAPSGNMALILSFACIQMKMTPEEAINAATVNGAYAMEVSDKLGSITKGKLANIFITKAIPSYPFIPYAFGANHIETVILKGEIQ